MKAINQFLDPILIIPYRWLDDPVGAWWLGTAVLTLACLALGELTMALGRRLNRAKLREMDEQAQKMHDGSLQALRQGDKGSYKAMNKLANEAFGRGFFMKAALGMASLWPAFLAAGWLEARFQGLVIALPGLDVGLSWLPVFLALYILGRLVWGRLKSRLAGHGTKAGQA